ncbi:hypothetical protein HTSR_1651 [Halodesulfurarchaeum formicicum]|uniref:Uncharacterized protein n=1 Tax=Halodesulfurarchaeum formicicum TaxID=1873524 RepID=A0A1D8S640_9EURY|nr:hypothetical protein HTSR_1651 [Halodesulfurarchaeum formicicum]
MAVTGDDRLDGRGLQWKLQWLPRQNTEIEEEPVVDEEGTPADLAGPTEEA